MIGGVAYAARGRDVDVLDIHAEQLKQPMRLKVEVVHRDAEQRIGGRHARGAARRARGRAVLHRRRAPAAVPQAPRRWAPGHGRSDHGVWLARRRRYAVSARG